MQLMKKQETILKRFYGLQGSAAAWLVSGLAAQHGQVCLICHNNNEAEELAEDLKFFVGGRTPVLTLPAWDPLPFEPVSPQSFVSAARLQATAALAQRQPLILVATAAAVMQKMLPAEMLPELGFSISAGSPYQHSTLLKSFDRAGYRPVSLVEELGDLAVHGSVIDFFPPGHSEPWRLEFRGDQLVSIRNFSINTQRSSGTTESLQVLPVRELPDLSSAAPFQHLLPAALTRLKERARQLETPPREVAKAITALTEGQDLPGKELLLAAALDNFTSFFDLLAPESVLVPADEIQLQQTWESFEKLIAERAARLAQEHYLIPEPQQLYLSAAAVNTALNAHPKRIYLDQFNLLEQSAELPAINYRSIANIELQTKMHNRSGREHTLKPLQSAIEQWRRAGCRVALVAGSTARRERLLRELLALDLQAVISPLSGRQWASADQAPLVILAGSLNSGCQLPQEQLVFVAENELFAKRSHRRSGVASARSIRRFLSSLAHLQEENFIVHEDYGIGRYQGLVQLKVAGVVSDFLQIQYADSTLYLPVQNIGKVQKYSATEGQVPNLDRLGSRRWVKTKGKVQAAVASLAGDLLRLYAARSQIKGWRYEPAGGADENFADDFPFDETPDQLSAISATLGDLAAERPMDRLICGDVGFGKTEVALRAAYKVLQHCRQVAILVPTTILAEQHYQTFSTRLRDYPFKVGVVSRFYRGQANQQTLQALAAGDLDVIIGTHRLLQRDVVFRDLGLLIVDEEHRFGVQQKEKIKQLRREVDVLTLTATPIPRTLHMSLLGIRDVSVISTPPQDRRLIQTYIANRSDTVIRDALLREQQRGGQSFFLHNRVQSIEVVAQALHELVPELRLAVAHGQMAEARLESIVRRFINREMDVLLCSTIIESGVDIPNVNTIIIDRAHQFGLAQLYQLRGRVGRSPRQAYAYLLIPPARRLNAEAQARLKVLQSLDDLGQGFQLALRDLEIRGAGNLLGKEQSGQVFAVGFELYHKILKEAVLNLKGDDLELRDYIDPEVSLGVSAYIPDIYIPDISERLVLYQRLAAIASEAEAKELAAEIEDRFGAVPEEVENLVVVMELRSTLREVGVLKAEYRAPRLSLNFSPKARIDGHKLQDLLKRQPQRLKLSDNLCLTIRYPDKAEPDLSTLTNEIRSILEALR